MNRVKKIRGYFGIVFFLVCMPMYGAYQIISQCPVSDNAIPDSSSQVIIVQRIKDFHAEIIACEKHNNLWRRAFSPFNAVIGAKGIAPIGRKKEGDMKTPAGLYPLGDAFGSKPLALKMDYKYITAEDKFIDDPLHKRYNTWVLGGTDAKSYESMTIKAYQMGVVVNYNMKPVTPGAGSAIFIHLWQSSHTPTHGCIAMDEAHLLKLLYWLDKKQHPYVFISG